MIITYNGHDCDGSSGCVCDYDRGGGGQVIIVVVVVVIMVVVNGQIDEWMITFYTRVH